MNINTEKQNLFSLSGEGEPLAGQQQLEGIRRSHACLFQEVAQEMHSSLPPTSSARQCLVYNKCLYFLVPLVHKKMINSLQLFHNLNNKNILKQKYSQKMDNTYTQVLCARCSRPPETSLITNQVFVTYLCYEDCGNVFWTQRKCPNIKCGVENLTRLISKPKTGQMIKCHKCQFECYYFRCPNKKCKKIMVKQANAYRMGQATCCEYCHQQFKLIVCSCGGQIYMNSTDVIYEGAVEYKCKECMKPAIYTTCPECLKPSYYFQVLEIGERIKCSDCKQLRNFVPCPACGKSIYCKDFHFGQGQKCHYCYSQFEYLMCPNGCGPNFYFTKDLNTPFRKCNRRCQMNFVSLNCNKCKHPLYIDNYQYGFWREEECPACKSEIRFHLCTCGLLTKNSNRCMNPQCPVPTACKNYSKEWKQLMLKQSKNKKPQQSSSSSTTANSDYDQKQCKLCYDLNSCMVNEECRHMMMCELCYRTIRLREGDVSRCPICKKMGRYHKYVEPILQ